MVKEKHSYLRNLVSYVILLITIESFISLILSGDFAMSKEQANPEKVNPGENCPHCQTTSKPGSTVCIGCGAVRRLDYVGTEGQWAAFVEKVVGFASTAIVFVAFFLCMNEETRPYAITAIIATIGLGVFIGVTLRKKYQKYAWFIQTPK